MENTGSENDSKPTLVVVSKVKAAVKSIAGLNTSADFIDQLSASVENIIKSACDRAKEDKRKTVMARDLA